MMLYTRALVIATLLGTVAQAVMVLAGHRNPAIANLFAVGGMTLSLLAGLVYAWLARPKPAVSIAAQGGALAGGLCGLLGIALSFFLGDVAAMLLLVGTLSSAATGAIGGLVGRLLGRPGLG